MLRLQNVREPAGVFINREFSTLLLGRIRAVAARPHDPCRAAQRGPEPHRACVLYPSGKRHRQKRRRSMRLTRQGSSRGRFSSPPWKRPNGRPRLARAPSRGRRWRGRRRSSSEDPCCAGAFRAGRPQEGRDLAQRPMVSRYWDIGPQKRAYLPEPWLKSVNTLTIVDEFGASPARAYLEYDELGLMRNEMV